MAALKRPTEDEIRRAVRYAKSEDPIDVHHHFERPVSFDDLKVALRGWLVKRAASRTRRKE